MKEDLEKLEYEHEFINKDYKFKNMIIFENFEDYELFKSDLMGEDGDVNFNKYIRVDPNNTVEIFTKWGCLEAYETIWEEEVPALYFSTLLDIPYILLESWSKEHPDVVFSIITAKADGKINDFLSFIYCNGSKVGKIHKPTKVTEEDLEKDYEDAYNNKYWKDSFGEDALDPTLENMQIVSKELKI